MSLQAKPGETTTIPFSLYAADGYTRLEDAAGQVTVELRSYDRAGGSVLVYRKVAAAAAEPATLAVTVAETDEHEYEASIVWPSDANADYQIVVRHPESKADLEELIQVRPEPETSLTNILLLLGGGVTGLPA